MPLSVVSIFCYFECLLYGEHISLYSYSLFFFSLGVRTTPDHKFGRAHLKNVASRGAKLKF